MGVYLTNQEHEFARRSELVLGRHNRMFSNSLSARTDLIDPLQMKLNNSMLY